MEVNLIKGSVLLQLHSENLEILGKLLEEFKLQHLPANDLATCQYLAAKAEAFYAKIG